MLINLNEQPTALFNKNATSSSNNDSFKTLAYQNDEEIAGVKVLRKILDGKDYYIPRELPKIEFGSFNGGDEQSNNLYNAMGKQNVIIYPNPAKTVVNYQYYGEAVENLQIFIYDATGRQVHNQNYKNGELAQISMQQLAAGIYQLICKSGKTIVNQQKIVKVD